MQLFRSVDRPNRRIRLRQHGMAHIAPSSEIPYHQLYIDGAWCAQDERLLASAPATGAPPAYVAGAGAADVDRAVAAARAVFDHGPWPHTPPEERSRILHTIADALEERALELAELETRDADATIRKTTYIDIPAGIEHLRTFAELARRHPYEPLPWIDMPSVLWDFVWREPIGVCGQIIPWNVPFLMAIWKIAPALATGNCVVIKPASLAPLSTIEIVRTIHETGLLPRGVVNLVTGTGARRGKRWSAIPAWTKLLLPAAPSGRFEDFTPGRDRCLSPLAGQHDRAFRCSALLLAVALRPQCRAVRCLLSVSMTLIFVAVWRAMEPHRVIWSHATRAVWTTNITKAYEMHEKRGCAAAPPSTQSGLIE